MSGAIVGSATLFVYNMNHLYSINHNEEVELNVIELLKDDMLAPIYRQDDSPGKFLSREYFRLLDFICNPNSYCKRNGLNPKDSLEYAFRQVKLPKDYKLPSNHALIVKHVNRNLEADVTGDLIRSAIKALRISTKTIEAYIDTMNDREAKDFRDDDGNPIDATSIITKLVAITANIPKDIANLDKLLEARTSASTTKIRGTNEYSSSMDGDDDSQALGLGDDDDDE